MALVLEAAKLRWQSILQTLSCRIPDSKQQPEIISSSTKCNIFDKLRG